MVIHFGCAQTRVHPVGCGVSLHVNPQGVAHIPHRQRHFARKRSARAHPEWSGRRGSNSWPRHWKGRALPAELLPPGCRIAAGQYRLHPAANCQRAFAVSGGAIRRSRRRPEKAHRERVEQKNKRPGSFRSPGLCEQSLEGGRLRAPLSRVNQSTARRYRPEAG